MRVLFWVVFVLAALAGGLYGVGYFLLPNDLEVSRREVIERPRAAVFAMANDLKIVKEWSPYYALDPNADYSFTRDAPGEGQSMIWRSELRQVGEGRMTIVRSAPNREVESILQFADRAMLNSLLSIERTENGRASVGWAVSATCEEGAVNIPCRYMNLVLRSAIEKDLDEGLSRLKTLAEQLPDIDFEGLQPEIVLVDPQSFVFVEASTSARDPVEVDRALSMGIDQVRRFMGDSSLTPAGPLVRATTKWDAAEQRMGFRVGYPFEGPAPLTVVGVQVGETPSGQALRVLHVGSRAGVQETYAKAHAYMQAHRIALRDGGLPWEIVLDPPETANPDTTRIAIYFPL